MTCWTPSSRAWNASAATGGPSQRVGEPNTKAGLIEPIIAALGWDVLDPDEVRREYRRRPADYALLLSRSPRLFIEAKGLGENINDPTERWVLG